MSSDQSGKTGGGSETAPKVPTSTVLTHTPGETLKGPTKGKAPWNDQPGLIFGEAKHLYPESFKVKPVSKSLDDISGKLQAADDILFAIDFEALCLEKATEYGYRYKPVTEIGFSVLDLRQLRVPPQTEIPKTESEEAESNLEHPSTESAPQFGLLKSGDRGMHWRGKIKNYNYIIDEYHDHQGHNCFQKKNSPAHTNVFAYGKNRYIREADIALVLQGRWKELRKSNRTPAEVKEGKLRNVVLLTWASNLEENIIARLGLGFFTQPGVTACDLQLHDSFSFYFNTMKNTGKSAEKACEGLGVDTTSASVGSLSHCAGNDSSFILEMFLALGHLTPFQESEFKQGRKLIKLPPSFDDHQIFQLSASKKIVYSATLSRQCQTEDSATSAAGFLGERLIYALSGVTYKKGVVYVDLPPALDEKEYEWVPKSWIEPPQMRVGIPAEELVKHLSQHFRTGSRACLGQE